jgi:methyl acetate hydrolase
LRERLDALLEAGIAQGAAPGAVFVVVNRDGLVYAGASGETLVGSGQLMTEDTVGAIFSMTKAITAAAAMQLVERGRLFLDQPAADICPQIGDSPVLEGFDSDGQPITRPPRTPVTLRHLLTHTSGYAYDFWNSAIRRWHEVTGTPDVFSLQLSSLQVPLMFDPGSRWEYGTGIDWVGQMVEAVSGLSLGEYFAEHLTGPLGMSDTAFAPSPDMQARAATLHARLPDGTLVPMDLGLPEHPEFEMGGGGLSSTMPDYGRFIRMMLNDGELDGRRVLAADTVQQMCQNQIGSLRVPPATSCDPQLSNDCEFFPGDPKSWGLSFQINEVPGFTGRPAGTLMWAGLGNLYYWIDRKNGIGGAYLSQILPFVDSKSLALYYQLEQAVYESL